MRQIRAMMLAALFAALTAAGALLRIPAPVSSFTMQIVFTSIAGILLGRRWGAASQAVYVLLGLAGLPIFASGGGLGTLLQPGAGFLLGLIPMAWVIGWMTERCGGTTVGLFGACLSGLAVLYLFGLPYMHVILTGYLQQVWTVRQTIFSGMLLFLPGDLMKLLLSGMLCIRIRPAILRIL